MGVTVGGEVGAGVTTGGVGGVGRSQVHSNGVGLLVGDEVGDFVGLAVGGLDGAIGEPVGLELGGEIGSGVFGAGLASILPPFLPLSALLFLSAPLTRRPRRAAQLHWLRSVSEQTPEPSEHVPGNAGAGAWVGLVLGLPVGALVGGSVGVGPVDSEQPAVWETTEYTGSLHAPPTSCKATQKKAPPLQL